MSRDKRYQQLLNSKRWKELRAWKLQRNPLCEICLSEGYIRSAIDVHHITPVETATNQQDMEALCFNPLNTQALCPSCHARIHREERSHSKQVHKQRAEERLSRWIRRQRENPPPPI